MANAPLLVMEEITKDFPGTRALKSVGLNVQQGEVHAIMGHNGAGKSTLMNILAGVFMPDRGTILLEGKPVVIRTPATATALGIRMVHQELSQFPNMSIMENLFIDELPRTRFGTLGWGELAARSAERLEVLGLSEMNPKTHICDLPIGQRQMVEICRALEQRTKILILDEPTSALGQEEVDRLFQALRKLKKEKRFTVLYISHRIDEVLQIADRITVLRDGENVGTTISGETAHEELVRMIVGKDKVDDLRQRDKRESSSRVVFRVEGLTSEKLKGVSFELREGEILGLAGLMGSGRTEILKAVFGADESSTCRITVNGKTLTRMTPHLAMTETIGFTPEDRKLEGLNLGLSVRENITLPVIETIRKAIGTIDKQREKRLVFEHVKNMNIITSGIERIVNTLSGGNQQKVCIAKCLTKQPKILLMDDPTRGIDVGAKEEIFSIMESLARSGVGILFVSSEFPEILRMCDRILVVYQGQIARELSGSEATHENLLLWATGGGQTKSA
jgi:ribose transport system ATP-binding protein